MKRKIYKLLENFDENHTAFQQECFKKKFYFSILESYINDLIYDSPSNIEEQYTEQISIKNANLYSLNHSYNL